MLVRALPPGSHRVGLGLLTAHNSTRIWRMQVIVVHAGSEVVQGRCGVDHDGHYAHLLERDMPFPQLICGLNGLTRRAASWNIGLSCSPRGSVQFAEAHTGMAVFSETTSARYPTDVLPAKRVSPLHRSCIMTRSCYPHKFEGSRTQCKGRCTRVTVPCRFALVERC